jgi:hypothetical protein
MLEYFARSIQPGDLITWMLIKDLADHRVERFSATVKWRPLSCAPLMKVKYVVIGKNASTEIFR